MRDKKLLHPELQAKIALLEKDLEKENIKIGWAETLRTKAEQDNLYAKGRSKPGPKVTNAPGDSYRSMHQWGIAADFYLIMDIDGDGQTKDDAYNNAKKTFNRVGQVAKKLGLEWGGDWKSIRVGARVYYVLFYLDQFRLADGSIDWAETYRIWDGGLAIYGAVIAAFLTAWLVCRKKQLSLWALADCCVAGFFIGQAIGRWGNFFNREESHVPFYQGKLPCYE